MAQLLHEGTWGYLKHKKTHKESSGRKKGPAQYILSFLIITITVGISVGNELLSTFNFDTDYLTVALIAIVVSLLTAHRQLFLIVLVVGMSFIVNLPPEMLVEYGLNKTILLGTLIAIIFEPFLRKLF